MNVIDAAGQYIDQANIRADLELHKSTYQQIEGTLENLKGIKGKDGISKAAKGFESLFIYRMLQEMRKTVPKDSLLGNSFGIDVFMSMFDEKIADRIAESGKFSLSDMLIPYLEKKYESGKEADTDNSINEKPVSESLVEESKIISRSSLSENVNRFLSVVNEAASEFKLDPDLLKAVIAQESGGKPNAVSRNGAKGLMQLMDSTAAGLDVKNIFDPRDNIFAGARYLKELLIVYNGDLKLALAAYNAGPGAVKLYNGIPPYSETRNFIQKVIELQKQFRSGDQI